MHATHKPLSLQLVCHQGNNSVVKITDLFCIVHIWTSCVDTKMLYSCTLMQSGKRLLHYHTTSSHVLLFAVRVLKKGAWNYSWQCFSWSGPVLNGTLAHSLCSSLSMISGWSVADFKFLGFVEYGSRGSWCWLRVRGCGLGVNTTLGQGGCVVLTQGEPRQWVYASSDVATAGAWRRRVLPFTFEAHVGVLALEGVGACRVVELQADGTAVFCPVDTKGRAVACMGNRLPQCGHIWCIWCRMAWRVPYTIMPTALGRVSPRLGLWLSFNLKALS